ncbi:cell wall hydrolase [Bacillus sp. FJAT-44742]|uniref:cell wall hydrolase n=1 Tax=Bacillus sp. FJAT-44742 TaxID=2014005 RepID=UPI000C24D96C|nr:cell wall hydrolase [Bacillus sp. FJAT-44742]
MKRMVRTSFAMLLTFLFFAFLPDKGQAQAVLEEGSEGYEVTVFQEDLHKLGYLPVAATGYFGPLTTEAVRNFQYDFNLTVDGIAGPGTKHRIQEVHKMARIVYGEARGESFEGQVAVAAVMKNRLYSTQFPSSVSGVIFQRNAFTAVQDGQYNLTPDATAYRAVVEAWRGWDPSAGSLYYFNPDIATSEWIKTRTPEFRIGKHVFAY